MKSSRIKNFLFDLDGTLADTAPDVIACLSESHMASDIKCCAIDRSIIGPPVREMICKVSPGLSEEEVACVVAHFRRLYDNSPYPETVLYSGVNELLVEIESRGGVLYVVTNKPKEASNKILGKFEIKNHFKKVVTPDMIDHTAMTKPEMIRYLIKTEKLRADETIMVGDTASDITSAQANNLQSVAVLCGYGDERSIRSAEPTFTFNSIEEFKKYLSTLMKGKNERNF